MFTSHPAPCYGPEMSEESRKPQAKPHKPHRPGPGRGHFFVPTPLQREQVKWLKIAGYSDEKIAALIADPPISVESLVKHFRVELDGAMALANMAVAQSIYAQAVGSPAEYYTAAEAERYGQPVGALKRSEQPRVPSCGIYWSKVHMRWREPAFRHEHTGKDGAPLIDLTKLTDQQLDVYESLIRASAPTSPQPGGSSGGAESTRH